MIKVSLRILEFVFLMLISTSGLIGQETFFDPSTKNLIDSLDNRTKILEAEIPRLSAVRDANYFYKKRELDMTIFLGLYYRCLSDEDLDQAKEVIDSRLHASEKRRDTYSVEFYKDYQLRLTLELSKQRRRYQYLFQKEKIFKKEFYTIIKAGDEDALNRGKRLTDLALKYARDQKLDITEKYLIKYQGIIDAALYNINSEYDLKKLTGNETSFQKVFAPMIESDSLGIIQNAGLLVERCYSYAVSTQCTLDTNYFAKQRKIVLFAISDYNIRKGNDNELAGLVGQTIKARFDTLNREGIYKWNNNIIVVSHFSPNSKSENVNKGEAIMDADRRLVEYIRINRMAKISKEVKMGKTFIIPFLVDNKTSDFMFSPKIKKYQYMICYTRIENKNFTEKVSKLLPPIEFETITKK